MFVIIHRCCCLHFCLLRPQGVPGPAFITEFKHLSRKSKYYKGQEFYSLGISLIDASIMCTALEGDHNKDPFYV